MIVITLYIVMNFNVVVVSYIAIVKIANNRQRRLSHSLTSQQVASMRVHLRSARAVAVLILCFGFTTIPIALYFGVAVLQVSFPKQFAGMSSQLDSVLYLVTVTLAVANSMLNPIIYYQKIPEIKEGIQNIVHRRRRNRIATAAVEPHETYTSQLLEAARKRSSLASFFQVDRGSLKTPELKKEWGRFTFVTLKGWKS